MPRQTIGELVVIIGADIQEALSGLNQIGVSAQRMGRNMERTGRTLTRNVTAPIAAVGAAGFKMASDLETSFAKMEGLVGVQREQLDAWEGDVRSLATQYGKSATEAADALFFITSAGLEGSDAMEALEASLKASASGLGDTATIADLATSAMNAYGSDVLSAAGATDVLTAAVREGKLAPEELAGSIGRVLPLASAMGVRFDEVGAAMAAMSRTGTEADEAATQLRGIMAALLKPTSQAEDALSGMGLSAGGLRDQIRERGLLSVLQTLSERFQGNDEAAAQVFGNIRALSGVMDLMGANAETTVDIFAELEDSTGSLDTAFQAMSQTAGFQLKQALSVAGDLLIEIGNAVLPAATAALEKLTAAIQPATEWFANLSPGVKQAIVAVAGLAAAIGPLLLALGAIVSSGGAVIGAVATVGTVIAGLSAPILAAVAVLGGLAVAFGAAYAKSETFRSVVKAAVTEVGAVVKGVVSSIAKLLSELAEAFSGVFGEIVETLDTLFVGPFMELWELFGEDVKATFRDQWEVVKAILGSAWEAIKAIVSGAITVVAESIELGLNLIQGDWSEAWENVVDILAAMKETVVGIVTALWDGIRDVFAEKIQAVKAVFQPFIDGVVGAFETMKDVVVGNSIVPEMMDGVVAEFRRLPVEVMPPVEEMEGGVLDVFGDLRGSAVGEAATMVTDVVEKFDDLRAKIEEKLGPLPASVAQIFNAIRDAMDPDKVLGDGGGVTGTIAKWAAFITDLIGLLKKVWDAAKAVGGAIGGALGYNAFPGIGPGGPATGVQLPAGSKNGPPGGITNWQPTPWEGFGGGSTGAMDAIADLLSRLETCLGNAGPLNNNLVDIRDRNITRNIVLGDIRGLLGDAIGHLSTIAMSPALLAPAPVAPAGLPAGFGTAAVTQAGPTFIFQVNGDVIGVSEEAIADKLGAKFTAEADVALGELQLDRRVAAGSALTFAGRS